MAVVTVLGPGGYPRPPYASFAGKVFVKPYTRTFTVLSPGGYPRPPYGDFGQKFPKSTGHGEWLIRARRRNTR